MNISREEANILNPIICEEGSEGTLYRMGYILKHLQGMYLEGAPNMSSNEASSIFQIFGCVLGAIEFEKEAPTNGN